MNTIRAIDSHTGGEPTRVILEGGPDLGTGTLAQRVARFRDQYDNFRRATVCEPRGHDVIVGALLCPPHAANCTAGVIFYNNVGTIGMCGHGMIGVAATLRHLGQLGAGSHRVDTPVGPVRVEISADGPVTVENVASYRAAQDLAFLVDGLGEVVGDVAYGGNGFFLVKKPQFELHAGRISELTDICRRIRQCSAICDFAEFEINHVELFGPPTQPTADSKNFVLCPGGAYDRSPCGTGTSAKLACLAADGSLAPGEVWRQESITGSIFEATYRELDDDIVAVLPVSLPGGVQPILPSITGQAFVTAELTLVIDPADPFAWGIRS